jgi:hypothetical protein
VLLEPLQKRLFDTPSWSRARGWHACHTPRTHHSVQLRCQPRPRKPANIYPGYYLIFLWPFENSFRPKYWQRIMTSPHYAEHMIRGRQSLNTSIDNIDYDRDYDDRYIFKMFVVNTTRRTLHSVDSEMMYFYNHAF